MTTPVGGGSNYPPDLTRERTADFVTVKHGNNQEMLLVTWCPVGVLLQHLREKCLNQWNNRPQSSSGRAILELVDMDGNITNLNENIQEYAYTLVQPRQTYVLVQIDVEGDFIKYRSLLANLDKHHPKLHSKLESLSKTPAQRKAGSSWAALRSVTKFSALVNGKKFSPQPTETLSCRSDARRGSVMLDRSKARGRRGSILSEGKNKK